MIKNFILDSLVWFLGSLHPVAEGLRLFGLCSRRIPTHRFRPWQSLEMINIYIHTQKSCWRILFWSIFLVSRVGIYTDIYAASRLKGNSHRKSLTSENHLSYQITDRKNAQEVMLFMRTGPNNCTHYFLEYRHFPKGQMERQTVTLHENVTTKG